MLDTPHAERIVEAMRTLRELAPFDSIEGVARRMCVANGIPECAMSGCAAETCEHWKDWYADADAVCQIANALSLTQERLGPEFEKVLFGNLWNLYAR